MKAFFTLVCMLSLCFSLHGDDDVTGFWMTVDQDTHIPSSVVALYMYQGDYYGRIIATFDEKGVLDESIYSPKERAPGIQGHPFYCGLDIAWKMKPARGEKYKGSIIDPQKGKTYRAEIWRKGQDIILKGKLFIFSKNMKWPPFPDDRFNADFVKPDLSTFVPKEPITL